MPSISKMFFSLLLIANPFGCVPIFVALVKNFDLRTQRKILLRESILGGLLALILLYLGKPFLNAILIQQYAVNLSGGILIFLVAISMIFPPTESTTKENNETASKREPFVVPIATPLLAGGGLFATLMILADQAPMKDITIALVLCWLIVIPVSVGSVYIQRFLGKRGLLVLEQLMGMMLTMLAIEIMLGGVREFLNVHPVAFTNLLTAR